LSGIIKDSGTNETLIGVSIQFANTTISPHPTNTSTLSPFQKGNYTVICSYVGLNEAKEVDLSKKCYVKF
jgi:hypothetical protein